MMNTCNEVPVLTLSVEDFASFLWGNKTEMKESFVGWLHLYKTNALPDYAYQTVDDLLNGIQSDVNPKIERNIVERWINNYLNI